MINTFSYGLVRATSRGKRWFDLQEDSHSEESHASPSGSGSDSDINEAEQFMKTKRLCTRVNTRARGGETIQVN